MMKNSTEKQRYEDLLRQVKLNMSWSKINKLPRHLRPLAQRLWEAAKYQQPEDLKWVARYTKEHGLGLFNRDGPTT